jgi:hypothetical protein
MISKVFVRLFFTSLSLLLLLLLFKSVVCLRYVCVTPATIDEREDDDWLLNCQPTPPPPPPPKKEEKFFLTLARFDLTLASSGEQRPVLVVVGLAFDAFLHLLPFCKVLNCVCWRAESDRLIMQSLFRDRRAKKEKKNVDKKMRIT